MGQSLVRALRETQGAQAALSLCGAVASPASPRLGRDAALEGDPTGVVIAAEPGVSLKAAAVAVDFSVASCVGANARACALAGVPILVGTTGFDAATRSLLERTSKDIPVLIAPNTSVGVSVVAKLVSLAASGLGPSYDVEIFEAHHRNKRDAPSGTALALGEAVAGARGRDLEEVAVYDRAGQDAPRTGGSIGFSSLRAGDIVGEHTVTFAADGERVEITHRATDRITFARGALRAAEWLIGQPAGLYGMQHMLGL
jgi:4-hydroxy-tetrahydrodipicolinate reductase